MQRKIYKRALTLSPYRNGANEQVSWMFAYATDHVHRTKKESSICEILNRHGGLDLQGHEVLIDPPSLKDVFDYADLRELRIYPTRREHLNDPRSAPERYIRFDDFGESVFLSDFILSFERYTKKFRIVCRDDLCNAILMHQDEIIEALKE